MISVILPTYNESMNVIEMIEQIQKYVPRVEILVVDDDSPDCTWKIVKDLKLPNVKVIRKTKERGVGKAILTGIKNAKGNIIAWMDCDLTMPASLLPKMHKYLEDFDVVVGSRYVKGGNDTRGPLRILTSRLINLLANIVLNFKVKDYDSGFIMAKKNVLDSISFDPNGHGEYCIEFLYKASLKFRIKELGYVFRERTQGESKTAEYVWSIFYHGFKYITRIFKTRFG